MSSFNENNEYRDSLHRTRHIKSRPKEQLKRILVSLILGGLIVYSMLFIQLDYYIYKPGTAEAVQSMVHSETPPAAERGSFMLTTVRVLNTNMLNYLYALLAPNHELIGKEKIFRNGETEAEYAQRQTYIMSDSQSNALQAAYHKAGTPFRIETAGIMILQVQKGKPAEHILRAGDYIVELDGKPMNSNSDVISSIQRKQAGDTVEVTYKRKNETRKAEIVLASMTAEADSGNEAESRPIIGVVLAEVRSIKAEQENKQISIHAEDIGGPSAGLMFALEIYSRLVGTDLTKGYRIAGTGTIDPQGNVGVIGGIRHKIVAAHREKADIFFAPADLRPGPDQQFIPVLNYSDAKDQANKMKSNMEIVPVSTLDDALQYLQSLPAK